MASSPKLSEQTAHIGIQWQNAVGARLAQRTHPERLSDGVLVVRVPSSTWAQELSLLSAVVVDRLRAAGHPVVQLRFSVGASVAPPEPPPIVVRRVALPAALEASLARIEDPELRRLIAEAAAYGLARQRDD